MSIITKSLDNFIEHWKRNNVDISYEIQQKVERKDKKTIGTKYIFVFLVLDGQKLQLAGFQTKGTEEELLISTILLFSNSGVFIAYKSVLQNLKEQEKSEEQTPIIALNPQS